jgi:signal transduction histidine kinase
MTLHDMIRAARALVPGLRSLAMVGDRLEQLPYYRHFASELATLPSELDILDLTGLPIVEVRRRVAALPDHAAILYFGINRDEMASFVAAEVLPLIAEVAQRPIVVNTETYLGVGGTGGFVMMPGPIGQEAGRLALRILNGEAASSIPVSQGKFIRPIFDWQQLQRRGIAETMLPVGSEVRFRPRSIWDQYGWQVATSTAVIVVQSALIVGLYVEHRRRRTAERLARERLADLAYMNRRATVGQLSASIAHEVSQPLSAIVASANAALRWLGRSMPELDEARSALRRIVDIGHRASGIVGSIRAMVKRGEGRRFPLDVNDLVRSVLLLLQDEFKLSRIALQLELAEGLPHVVADGIQLEQVIVNLVMNAIEAMGYGNARPGVLRIASGVRREGGIELVIEDSGPGIGPEDIDRIFAPFFTTKSGGMGMGLSICRSIVEAHEGRLWAGAASGRGAVFHVVLPVSDREES